MKNELIEKITEVYNQSVGYETFGDLVEFYDEDGVVIMTTRLSDTNKIIINFGPSEDDSFEVENLDL